MEDQEVISAIKAFLGAAASEIASCWRERRLEQESLSKILTIRLRSNLNLRTAGQVGGVLHW